MPEATIDDVKTLTENLGCAFEDFKSANDRRLNEIEKKGSADTLTEQMTDTINRAISKMQEDLTAATKKTDESLAAIEKMAARPGFAGGAEANPDEAEHKAAFNSYLRTGDSERELKALNRKAMSVGSDPDGGYFVPADIVNKIVTRVFESTPMRQLASIETISTDALEMPRDTDEVTASWVGETTTNVDTDTPEVGMIRIPVHKLFAQPKATDQLLEDANVNVEEWLAKKVADKFARTEAAAFVTGTGIAQPRGFTTYTAVTTADNSRAWGQLQYVASGGSGAFTSSNPADKLIALVGAMKAFYLNGAVFLGPRAVYEAIRKFKSTGTSEYLWQPSLQAGEPPKLLGYPAVLGEDMPALAADSMSLAFANFKEGYQIVDRRGIRTLRDPYTAAPFVRFPTSKRVGGDVVNFEAIKLMKFASS